MAKMALKKFLNKKKYNKPCLSNLREKNANIMIACKLLILTMTVIALTSGITANSEESDSSESFETSNLNQSKENSIEEDVDESKRATPFRWGKRNNVHSQRSGPFRWGKRSYQNDVQALCKKILLKVQQNHPSEEIGETFLSNVSDTYDTNLLRICLKLLKLKSTISNVKSQNLDQDGRSRNAVFKWGK
jgi:hypothetical protein